MQGDKNSANLTRAVLFGMAYFGVENTAIDRLYFSAFSSLNLSVITGFADAKVAPTSPIRCARTRARARVRVLSCAGAHLRTYA